MNIVANLNRGVYEPPADYYQRNDSGKTVGDVRSGSGASDDLSSILALLVKITDSLNTLLQAKNKAEVTVTVAPVPQTRVDDVPSPQEAPDAFNDPAHANVEFPKNMLGSEMTRISKGKSLYENSLVLSTKAKGEKPDDIEGGVRAVSLAFPYFGRDSRSAYLKAIKTAMMKHGQTPASIFNEAAPVPGGYNITMKDGFRLHITDSELHMASIASRFSGGDEGMIADANFLLAVMAKREQMDLIARVEGEYYWTEDAREPLMKTYLAALAGTTKEIREGYALRHLGLIDDVSPEDRDDTGRYSVEIPLALLCY